MVMLDMIMPHMSGKETFIAIKQVAPKVKVLLTSGFSKNEEVEAILKLGVMDFIQKPFTLEELAKKTNAIVHRKA
jgi:DNA-binding NtrC family response regulator